MALLGCDRLAVVAWNDDLSLGTIRADTGLSLGQAVPATPGSAEAIRSAAVYAGEPRIEGFPPSLAGSLEPPAFVVRVPLVTANWIATFHALWTEPLAEDEAETAAGLLRTLTRLTSVAERSLREGEQLKLDSVLDGVADGVVVCTAATATPNAAARALLAIPLGVEFRTALFNPRDLDGKPYEHPEGHIPGAADDRDRCRRPLPDPGNGTRRPGARARRKHLPGARRRCDRLPRRHRRARARSAERAVSLRALQFDSDPPDGRRRLDARAHLGEPGVSGSDRLRARRDRRPHAAVSLVGARRAAVVRLRAGLRHPSGLPAQGRPAAARRGVPARGPRRRGRDRRCCSV